MKTCLAICGLLTGFALLAADIRGLLAPEGSFWERGPAELARAAGAGGDPHRAGPLVWSRRDRTQLRYAGGKNAEPLVWERSTRVCEILFDLDPPGGKLSAMTVSIYNRGDAGAMDGPAFRKLREEAEKVVAELAGTDVPPERDRMKLGGETIFSRIWRGRECRWQLLWCESDRGPEYLTLKIRKPDAPEERLRGAIKSDQDRRALPDRVKTDARGRKYLEIPMIDQGDKGYCAAATVARVMRYYGADVDQNQIAQLLGTDAQAGTSWSNMLRKLELSKSRLNVRSRVAFANRAFDTPDSLRKFLSRYNKIAKSRKLPALKLDDFIETQGRDRILRLDLLNEALDREAVREVFRRDRGIGRFRQEVRDAIDRGLPLLWMIPGHIRLIVGYDAEQDLVLYSDSWGAAHERSEMPFADAFGMTLRLLVLEPR